MPNVTVIEPTLTRPQIAANTMRVGQVAIITDTKSGSYGHVLLRTYDRFVSLSSPHNTWRTDCTLRVDILPPGTTINFVTEI